MATGTYAGEEKKEFLKFQKSRAQHVKPFMQEIKIDIYPKTQSMHRTSLYFVQKEKKKSLLSEKNNRN